MDPEAFSRHHLIQALMNTKFINESTWCYLNSGMTCFLWTLLHRRECALEDFGVASSVCETLMQQPRGKAVKLSELLALQPLLRQTHEKGPRDCAEFTAELLEWSACSSVDMCWERRVSMANQVMNEETGGKYQPLALDGLYELDHASPTIYDLCQLWTYGQGMRAAFTKPPCIKCISADRLMSLTRCLGHFQPIDVFSMVELPHFYGSGVDLHWSPYRVQAVICHLGSSRSGHFRAALRFDARWLLCQDNETPQVVDDLPPWCLSRSVLFWLLPITEAKQTQDSSDSEESTPPVAAPPPPDSDAVEDPEAPPRRGALSHVLQSVLDDTATRSLGFPPN